MRCKSFCLEDRKGQKPTGTTASESSANRVRKVEVIGGLPSLGSSVICPNGISIRCQRASSANETPLKKSLHLRPRVALKSLVCHVFLTWAHTARGLERIRIAGPYRTFPPSHTPYSTPTMSQPHFLHTALNDSITSGRFIDTKFYVFSRRDQLDRVGTPKALFANSRVLATVPYFEARK